MLIFIIRRYRKISRDIIETKHFYLSNYDVFYTYMS